MKTDNYALKLNGTTVSVWKVIVQVFESTSKRRMQRLLAPPVSPANYSEPQCHKSPVINSCKEKKLFPCPRRRKTITRLFTTTDS